jgi:rhodanese-related sulfurtransferase
MILRLPRKNTSIAPRAASDQFFTGRLVLVDVRSHHEYEQVRVPGVVHIPLGQLRRRLEEIRIDRPVAFVCRSGHRSAIAARRGSRHRGDVATVTGGMKAWLAAGLPVTRCAPSSPPRRPGRD